MTATAMQRLRQADPVADQTTGPPEDLLAQLLAGPGPAPTTSAPRLVPARRAAVALAGCAVAGAAIVVALPGGAGPAPDAQAQLVSAAERTAAFASGRVTLDASFTDPATDRMLRSVDATRFEGDDVASRFQTDLRGLSRDGAAHHAEGEYRLVGGQGYLSTHRGRWQRIAPAVGMGEQRFRTQLDAAEILVGLARDAPGVTSETTGDTTTFHADVPAEEIPGVFGYDWRATGERPDRPVRLEVLTGNGGPVRRLTLREPGRHVDVTFDGLGAPQGITAP